MKRTERVGQYVITAARSAWGSLASTVHGTGTGGGRLQLRIKTVLGLSGILLLAGGAVALPAMGQTEPSARHLANHVHAYRAAQAIAQERPSERAWQARWDRLILGMNTTQMEAAASDEAGPRVRETALLAVPRTRFPSAGPSEGLVEVQGELEAELDPGYTRPIEEALPLDAMGHPADMVMPPSVVSGRRDGRS